MKNHYGKQQLTEQLFHNREYQISHPTYDTELAFYNMVCNGDVENSDNGGIDGEHSKWMG